MLDITTLRVALGVVALCVFALVYFGTYRRGRASFAGWWSAAILLALMGNALYMIQVDSLARIAAALGNSLGVTSVVLMWTASRTLNGRSTQWWLIIVTGLALALGSYLENPSGAAWPGGSVALVGMALFLGLTGMELVRVARQGQLVSTVSGLQDARASAVVLAITAGASALFYVYRLGVFIALGPQSHFYQTWAGPSVTALGVILTLVVVTYTVTDLARFERAQRWHTLATTDDLTGLLTRHAFHEQAHRALDRAHARDGAATVVIADFDYFKALNDDHGHACGDRALAVFGDACRHVLTDADVAGRLGGEEFVILVAHGGVERGINITRSLDNFLSGAIDRDAERPTISYGIAVHDGSGLETLVDRADAAMYDAKRSGRAQTRVYEAAQTLIPPWP